MYTSFHTGANCSYYLSRGRLPRRHFCSTSWVPVLACHYPVLDGFNQNFQASVHFPLASANKKSQQHQNNFLEMPRIKPKAAGLEARMLPLWFAAPLA